MTPQSAQRTGYALQLVGPKTRIYNEAQGKILDESAVKERFELSPQKLLDFFSLTGDSSDNVPGVPGIGEKTAIKLLKAYGSLEEVLEAARRKDSELSPKLRQALLAHADQARLSRKLVTLQVQCPISLSPEECRIQPPKEKELLELFQRLEFSKLLN